MSVHAKSCPKCGTPWEETQNIYEFFKDKYKSQGIENFKEKAAETAECYGCTVERPKHFGKDVIGIEIQGMYDGISFWECLKCETTFDRWTMKEVHDIKDIKNA